MNYLENDLFEGSSNNSGSGTWEESAGLEFKAKSKLFEYLADARRNVYGKKKDERFAQYIHTASGKEGYKIWVTRATKFRLARKGANAAHINGNAHISAVWITAVLNFSRAYLGFVSDWYNFSEENGDPWHISMCTRRSTYSVGHSNRDEEGTRSAFE